ncbi:PAP2-domain-containing protein [Viridothelium virens]|uniref:PAP2-domain-containing protein n=1 Tax=Viridothelium virens TaxID=1048519 RepID=A0A6A6HPA4_VIRVR|nr:PAP2-domain-containing protein [Viridothelium virens]
MVTGSGFVPTVRRLWTKSYASDYVGLAIVVAANALIGLLPSPFHQMFSLDDTRIQYPHADPERVPVFWLLLFAGFLPLGILVVWSILLRPGLHRAHVTILGLFISVLVTNLITDIIKNAVGRPRPDLLSRCKPKLDTPNHELVTVDVCTETNHHKLHDGWRSFPSGHSSFSFSGLGYLSLFLAGQLRVLRPRTDLVRLLITAAPLVGAFLVAVSRIEDYRHDKYDVTAGSLLGLLVAFLTYRRYYPSLRSQSCDTPHPNRADNDGFSKLRDEEEVIGSAGEYEVEALEDGSASHESHPLTSIQR